MERWKARGAVWGAVMASTLAWSGASEAALTASEKGTIKDAFSAAQPSQAARVRALVARPDLAPEETEEALRGGLEPVRFDEARSAFVRELAFGQSSAASRPAFAPGLVGALLSRADAVLTRRVNEADPHGGDEAAAIYAEVARLTGGSRAIDPQLPRATVDLCLKRLLAHVEKNARHLKLDQPIGRAFVRARAQAALAAWAMFREAPTARVDFADAFGLAVPQSARRALFLERGMLLFDAGKADDARVLHVRALVDRVPALRDGAGALYFGDAAPSLVSRAEIVAMPTELESTAVLPSPWGEEVEPGPTDPVFSNTALDLARWLTSRALARRGELRLAALEDGKLADAPRAFGAVADATPEAAVAAAVHLLLLDAPRAVDWALARSVAGQPRPAAILADALGVLASYGRPHAGGLSLPLGKPRADGSQEGALATDVRLGPQGAASQITLAGHVLSFERDAGGAFGGVKRDGAAVTLAMLPTARTPLSDQGPWVAGGLSFARLRGAPLAAATPAPRVRMLAKGGKGYDVIAARPPAEDFVLEADLSVTGAAGGVGVRATLGRDSVRGARVVLDPAGPSGPRVALVSTDENGQESFMTAPLDQAFASPTHVKITVKGAKVEVLVGSATLRGTLPESNAKGGEIVLFGRPGASVDAAALTAKPLGPPRR